jgi:choline dehydrogenase
MRAEHCDYAVIGAGSAGCVLARRLSERGARVVVLERGVDSAGCFRIPGLSRDGFDQHVAYDFTSDAAGPPRRLTSAAVVGGGSALNAMIYVRGPAADYDGWREAGADAWSYADVLPYFKRSEHQQRGASAYHGVGGPLPVSDPRHVSDLSAAFVAAALQRGIPGNVDFNGAIQAGVGYFQLTQRRGARVGCAEAFLAPALRSGGASLVTGAEARRILLRGTTAVGIEYAKDGRRHQLDVDHEVLVCAGALRSPHILMLSGIGPAEHLRSVGVGPAIDLPGVGQDLQDHVGVPVVHARREVRPVDRRRRDRLLWTLTRRGPWASNGIEAGAFACPRGAGAVPEIEYLLHCSEPDTVVIEVCLLAVQSRGTVALRSADAGEAPAITIDYLRRDGEMRMMADGVRVARAVASTAPLAALMGAEVEPGRGASAALRKYIRAEAASCKHYAGTCRIGRDAGAVVDARLRVHGAERLRVVDASVMPVLPRGHTNAATIMIAERASDFLRA